MKSSLIILLLFISTLVSFSQNAQFRGPNRDGKFPAENLLKEWPENGPEMLLEVGDLGKGYSPVIPTEYGMFVTGMIDTLDQLTCVNYDGTVKWKMFYGESWKKSFPDTRSPVTVDGDKLYVISGNGQLTCINAEDGAIIWKKNIDLDYSAEWHTWGVSESPLVIDNMVICSPSGEVTSFVALDKNTGTEIWKTKSVGGSRSYASTTTHTFNGITYIIACTTDKLLGLNPQNGEVAFEYDLTHLKITKERGFIWTNIPTCKDGRIFLSTGYNIRSAMVEIDSSGNSINELFIDRTLDNHHHGLIEHDGYIYGANWKSNREARWVCMDWKTGEIEYVHNWETKGMIVFADGMLYCYDEKKGNVALVKPSPKGFDLVSSFKFKGGGGQHWAHPYIYDGKLFMRQGSVMKVYNIAK